MLGHGGLECELAGHFHKSKGTKKKKIFVMDHSGRKTLFGHGGLVFELAENYQIQCGNKRVLETDHGGRKALNGHNGLDFELEGRYQQS